MPTHVLAYRLPTCPEKLMANVSVLQNVKRLLVENLVVVLENYTKKEFITP